eukprot:Ihof_evm3s229 gene=Ihof_evmTU3s229
MYQTAKSELTNALNAGERHPAIADTIVVSSVYFGSTPPKLDIVEISEVTEVRVRGTFRIRYDGDAYIELTTKAQANPVWPTLARARAGRRATILAAAKPLIVPIHIRISALELDGIGVLDMHVHRGTTLTFKNDPLVAVKINTSFDEQPAIQEMLQSTLEEELRDLFNKSLPQLVHTLSLQHLHPKPNAGSPQCKMQRQNSAPLPGGSSIDEGDLLQSGAVDQCLPPPPSMPGNVAQGVNQVPLINPTTSHSPVIMENSESREGDGQHIDGEGLANAYTLDRLLHSEGGVEGEVDMTRPMTPFQLLPRLLVRRSEPQ